MIDNSDLFEIYDREREQKASRLPTCDCCGEPIYGKALMLWGKVTCESCVEDHMEYITDDDIY